MLFYAAVHDLLLLFQKYDLPFYSRLILSHVCICGLEQAALGAVECVYSVCTHICLDMCCSMRGVLYVYVCVFLHVYICCTCVGVHGCVDVLFLGGFQVF